MSRLQTDFRNHGIDRLQREHDAPLVLRKMRREEAWRAALENLKKPETVSALKATISALINQPPPLTYNK